MNAELVPHTPERPRDGAGSGELRAVQVQVTIQLVGNGAGEDEALEALLDHVARKVDGEDLLFDADGEHRSVEIQVLDVERTAGK